MTIINYYYICLTKKTKMKKLLLTLLCFPLIGLSQVNYTVTVNTPDAWQANLFFQLGGTPIKPVKIIDPSITELYSQDMGMKGWDFKVNYNNKLSYFDRASKGWFIMDSLQNEIDSVYCLNGYTADNHDFLALANGNYVLFAYDEQPYAMDTVVAGGDPNAMIEGLIIQELDANHNLVFEWKSWDHFHVTDNAYFSPWTGANLPFIHANAIDIDFDGHFLISCRGLDEITKIHRTTGEIIWRWGGTQNEFTFVNDYPFTHQHAIRSLGNNRYLLYDNGNYSAQYTGTINISRAVEYELDTNLMEATKVWEFVHPDSLYTPSIGGVQRLPNGNTLIDFGNLQWLNIGSIVTEVDANNQIVFQLEYNNGGNLYRAQKFDWFFYSPTLGCTDSLACNYDPLATIDDGSCVYSVIWQQTYSICDGDSVVIGSSIYNTTGNYIDSLNASNGCDSIVYTYLFVDQNTTSYDTLSVAASIVWNGMPLNVAGDYSATLINSVGCDSIANLNLTVTTTGILEISNKSNLIKITDMLGQETPYRKNTPLFYIYDDGTVEKRIIIE
jgi:hypothetical protein